MISEGFTAVSETVNKSGFAELTVENVAVTTTIPPDEAVSTRSCSTTVTPSEPSTDATTNVVNGLGMVLVSPFSMRICTCSSACSYITGAVQKIVESCAICTDAEPAYAGYGVAYTCGHKGSAFSDGFSNLLAKQTVAKMACRSMAQLSSTNGTRRTSSAANVVTSMMSTSVTFCPANCTVTFPLPVAPLSLATTVPTESTCKRKARGIISEDAHSHCQSCRV